MPTIADEFIVRLGLDPTSFRAGAEEAERLFNKTKDAARKSGKQMEESNKTLAETFNVVKRELIGFYAAMLGGRAIKEFIGDTTEAAASLGRFAQNIGAMPEQVVGWEAAVERMGGTAEDANKSLNAMSKALFDVRNMGQPLAPELYRLQAGFGEIAATRFDTGHGVVPFMDDIAAQAKKLAEVDPQGAFRLLQGAGISELGREHDDQVRLRDERVRQFHRELHCADEGGHQVCARPAGQVGAGQADDPGNREQLFAGARHGALSHPGSYERLPSKNERRREGYDRPRHAYPVGGLV